MKYEEHLGKSTGVFNFSEGDMILHVNFGVILKTYQGWVSLKDPSQTWSPNQVFADGYFRPLLPGESVTLTQE